MKYPAGAFISLSFIYSFFIFNIYILLYYIISNFHFYIFLNSSFFYLHIIALLLSLKFNENLYFVKII